jgi:hypothetical protein
MRYTLDIARGLDGVVRGTVSSDADREPLPFEGWHDLLALLGQTVHQAASISAAETVDGRLTEP